MQPKLKEDIYQKIIYRLAKKYQISDLEIERIVDSQFKIVLDTINERGIKTVQLKHLGKFTAIKRRVEYEKTKTKLSDN